MPTLPSNCAQSALQAENWKPVAGFYGSRYEVSDLGRVRNHETMLVLSHCPTVRGYIQVTLKIKGVKAARTVHRLVAEAFLGPCPIGKEVNHKNGIKTDAALSNLEYVTPKQNIAHAISTGLMKPRTKKHYKLSPDDVRQIRRLFGIATHIEIGARFGVGARQITAIRGRRAWADVE